MALLFATGSKWSSSQMVSRTYEWIRYGYPLHFDESLLDGPLNKYQLMVLNQLMNLLDYWVKQPQNFRKDSLVLFLGTRGVY